MKRIKDVLLKSIWLKLGFCRENERRVLITSKDYLDTETENARDIDNENYPAASKQH